MVRVVVPSVLAAQAEGRTAVRCRGGDRRGRAARTTVADLVIDERGELRQYLNVYVDGTDARERGGLACPLAGAQRGAGRRHALRRLAAQRLSSGVMLAAGWLFRGTSAREGRAGRPRDRVREARSAAGGGAPRAERSAGAARRARNRQVGPAGLRRRARRGLSGPSCAGVEWEMELPFAGLHQLCVGLLDGLERLPTPQRDALATAFGLSSGAQPDRFLVGLAVLSLLSDAAEERPLVCLVDDAQWLDRSSAQVLAFVARRLAAESVVLVFAERDPGGLEELAGLPELRLEGLPDASARELLASVLTAPLDERVRDRILAETRGNPLALLELPRGSPPAALAGGFGLPGDGSLSGRIEASFGRRVEQSARGSSTAAARGGGRSDGRARAAHARRGGVGIPMEELAPAEADGLLQVGVQVAFRHSLLRSAIYRGADRDAPGGARGAGRRYRCRARSRSSRLASRSRNRRARRGRCGELERSAERARARGGLAAAAAFLERAAALTADPGASGAARTRGRHEQAARRRLSGRPDVAGNGGRRAAGPARPRQLQRLHGQILLDLRRAAEAEPLLWTPPVGSNRSIQDWHATRIWRRSEPGASPAGLAGECSRPPKRLAPHRHDRGGRARSTCCSMG